ncbi:MAG: DNA integrity scanning protein DisA nucleotide-binding domain protein [Acidimicrobiia bacterium]|nr:DNA integrity scanning protein DisA nucleotide-binding domain protein [Acidimicrobiia bacterium]
MTTRNPSRIRRLAEELDEIDPSILASPTEPVALLEELDYALRPAVHERRVPSYGAFVEPTTPLAAWVEAAGFEVSRRRVEDLRDATVRRFADGIVSWVVRDGEGVNDLVVFDRSVGSERDLTILAAATGGAIVQRHPTGRIRAVGTFGVLRRDDIDWHLEPPVERWLDLDRCHADSLPGTLLTRFVRFAVHDVGARRIGALFVISPRGRLLSSAERRYGKPPEFNIDRPADLAPLYHILGQLDGAAVFDESGTLQELGVRLVPSVDAESNVDRYRGTRHTSALRYSYDDPAATLIVVSEDGPVSVLRAGVRLGQSA